MANREQLEKKIAELKKGLASGEKVGLPEKVKENLEKLLAESENELAEMDKEPKKEEPKKEEAKAKSKPKGAKMVTKKEPEVKVEKPKSALERCKELLSRYKKQKKTSSVRAEKRRKAGKPATLTPAEAVSKTAKSVKVKVVSIKEKTDAGLSKGEINKMVSGIVSTIKATLDGIVTSADKNEFLREIQAEIRDLRTDMPKVAEMGGSVDFNSGAGMFAGGGGVGMQYKKDWEVTGITLDGKMFKKTITLGRMSDATDVKNAIKRMQNDDFRVREVTNIKELKTYKSGGALSDYDILAKTIVYDNNGESLDRYTVFTPDGSVYGMSQNAEGFNQYLGEKDEVRKGSHLGKKLTSVPENIKTAVLQRMRYEQGGTTDFNEGAGMFANGGIFGSSRYNSGRSWHQDRARHNQSEKWEKPLSQRKSN
jgi:hypothetical protein